MSSMVVSFFKNPVPVLSANNVDLIKKKMEEGFDYFVEYGMGASTLYFIREFAGRKATLVSVENTIGWFGEVVAEAKRALDVRELSFTTKRMTLRETYAFIRSIDAGAEVVPPRMSRRRKWKDSLLLGPFYRFSPLSDSRLSGKLPLWFLARPLLAAAGFVVYLVRPDLRPTHGEFRGQAGSLSVVFRNVPPPIKDQFGESPNVADYINAGLADIKAALAASSATVKAIFVVDGGPRGEIVRAILALEKKHENFHPAIFLCDAHQAFYRDVTLSRPTGVFLPGTNVTLKGDVVQVTPRMDDEEAMTYMFGKKSVSKEELAEKEVWFYERADKRVTA